MNRALFMLGLTLCGCASTAGPDDTSPEPMGPSKVRPALGSDGACISSSAAELLDACKAGGVTATRPLLSSAAAGELYDRAEQAWRAQRWTECSELFTDVSELHPDRGVRAEASYSAVICYNNDFERRQSELDAERDLPTSPRRRRKRRLSEEELERSELGRASPRSFTPLEVSMELAYARNICLAPDSDEVVSVKYRRARVHYVANHWEAAATLFKDIVDNHSSSELASYAASQYLDCLNGISRLHSDRRTSCRDQLAAEVERLLANDELMRDADFRDQLSQLRCGIIWHRAEAQTEMERFREAAELYISIYSESRDACEFIGSHDICEVLYNAAVNYEADHCIEAALQVRSRLMSDCGDESEYAAAHGRASPWAKQAVHQSGGNYHALGEHAKAAQAYEDFARRYPGEREARGSLRMAIGLRVALDQGDEALADAQLFEKIYGRRRVFNQDTASAVFAVGAAYSQKSAWVEAERHYDGFLRRYGSVARPDEVIRAHVELGSARLQRGGASRAKGIAEMRRAVTLAEGDGGDALARYRALVMTADTNELDRSLSKARLALLVEAVARAREALGEEAPERALAPTIGISLDRAIEELTFVATPEGVDSTINQCELDL